MFLAPPAAATATGVITSNGPLKNITISADLNCSVNYDGDTQGEFYNDKACGTLIAVGNSVYGPAEIPKGPKDGTTNGYKKFTKVSQTSVSGAGTVASPYKVVTVVDAGTTKIRLTQTDSYVVGQQSYRTDVQVSNTAALGNQNVVLYRAGDCFVNNDDKGFGAVDTATGAVSCVGASNGPNGTRVPDSRTEQFSPITSGSRYMQGLFSNVWNAVLSRNPLPNTCQCSIYQDNGAGLSWSMSLLGLTSSTKSSQLTFSPIPMNPLVTTKTADNAQVSPGDTTGYTISLANPNTAGATITSFGDDLPVGFTYQPGSTTGATTADPTVTNDGRHLQWNGTFLVAGGATSSLHFRVTASTTPGDYFNQAGGTASGTVGVTPTGDTALVRVLGPAELNIAANQSTVPASPGNIPTDALPLWGSPSLASSGLLNLNLLGSGLLNLNLLGSGLLNLNLLGSGILNLNLLGSGLLNLNLLGSGLLNLNLLGSPLGFDSLGNLDDLGGSPLVREGLSQLLLTELPIKNGDDWATRAIGTPIEGRPLATLTFYDALTNIPASRMPSLSDLDLTVGPLGRLSSMSLYMGDTRLTAIRDVDWCGEFERLGYADCGAALGVPGSPDKGKSASLISLEIAGVALNDIEGLKEIQLGDVTFSNEQAAIPHLLLRSIDMYQSVFGSLLVKDATAAIDCGKIDCTSATKNFYDAQQAGAIKTDATIATLGSSVASVTILEAIANMAMGDVSTNPLDLSPTELGVLGYSGNNPIDVNYTLTFSSPTTLTNPVVNVTLPSQFRLVPGTSLVKIDGSPFPSPPSPTAVDELVTWSFANATFPAGKTITITFAARPGLTIGALNASAVVSAGGFELNAFTPQPINVVDSLENGDTIANLTPVTPGQLYFSSINHAGDSDYYSFTAPAGSTINGYLTQGDIDADLVLYHPASARPHNPLRPPTAAPAIDATLDRPLTLGQQGEPLDPAALNDIPVLANLPLAGISGNRDLEADSIQAVAWDAPAGSQYIIQVSGYNGAFGVAPYGLHITVTPPSLNLPAGSPRVFPHDVDATRDTPTNPASWTGTKSLLIVDRTRLRRAYGDTAAETALAAIGRLEAAGVGARALYVDAFSDVAAAMATLDAQPSDPERSNDVVRAINSRVDATLGAARDGLQHIVLVGTDEILPMSRVPDLTAVANQRSFAQELRALAAATGGNNALIGAAAAGMILSDDAYGSFSPVPFLGSYLYTPDVALGRLVESPADIAAVIDQFLAPVPAGDPIGTLRPAKSLVTGTDFMKTMASEIRATLNAEVTPNQVEALISDSWTKSDLASALFGGSVPDVISANAHYSPNALLPGDGRGGLFTTGDFAGSPDIARRVLFQMGCHSGFSISNFLDPTGNVSDWPEAMLSRGTAAFVGNTGFGIGLRNTTAFSARITADFAKNMAAMPLGTALAQAKRDYLGGGTPNVYDYKVMAEATYFGLPMFRLPGAGDGPVVPAPRPTTTDSATGLTAVDIATSQPVSSGLWERINNGEGFYWQLAPGRQLAIAPNRPIQPKLTFDVTQPNLEARGAYLTKLSSVSESNFDPALARIVIGESANEDELSFDEVIFPTAQQAITHSVAGGVRRDTAVLIPARFESTSSNPVVGVESRFTAMNARVLYAPLSNSDRTPPSFHSANVLKNGTTASFKIDVTDPDGGAVRDVSVLFTDGSSPDWTFRHLALAADGTWVGGFPVTGTAVQFIAQAVDAAGNVGLTTNKGTFFDYANRPAGTGEVQAEISGEGANGWYQDGTTVSLSGDENTTFEVSDNGGPVTIYASGQPIPVTGSGVHTLHFRSSPGGASGDVTVPIDTTVPTISGETTTAPNAAGWYRGPVTVHFTCDDNESGIATCEPDRTVSTDGAGQSVTGRATDRVGNSSTTTVGGINIDSTPPAIGGAATTAPNANGWYNGDVTVRFTCTDERSGIASCPADQTITGEGSNLSATGTAVDVAGNTTSYTVSGIKIDRTAPTISGAATTQPNANGWYRAPVTIAFTCSDGAGSGVANCPANQTMSTNGANQSLNATIVDLAGNSATGGVSGINIDTTGPVVTGAPDRAANANGWYNAPVTVNFTCADPLSGVATCNAPVTVSGDGTNLSATGSGTDTAGNTNSTTVGGINIDKVAPTITATPNDTTWRKGPVTVTFTCADDRSGVASCPAAVSVTTPGLNTVTRSVTDKAGNTKSISVVVRVDNTGPVANFNASGLIIVLPGGNISGTATDDYSGVATVTVKFVNNFGGGVTTTNATVSCAEPRTSCTWTVRAPILLGSYKATPTSTDRAGNVQSTPARDVNVLS